MYWVQSKIAALGSALVQDRTDLESMLEYSNEQIFSFLVKKLLKKGRQAKIKIYEKSQKTFDVYADGWYFCLNVLNKAVTDATTAADAVQTASDVIAASAPEAQIGSDFQGIAGECFQFDAESEPPGAGPEPNSFYPCIPTR